jgi:predicted RNase H-like HicB family nuclease
MSDQTEPIRYSMIIEWEPVGEVYVVTIPELPGCRTHGRTYEEAVQQGQEAIEGWIDAKRHWGRIIPPPRFYDLGDWQETADIEVEAEPATARAGD